MLHLKKAHIQYIEEVMQVMQLSPLNEHTQSLVKSVCHSIGSIVISYNNCDKKRFFSQQKYWLFLNGDNSENGNYELSVLGKLAIGI